MDDRVEIVEVRPRLANALAAIEAGVTVLDISGVVAAGRRVRAAIGLEPRSGVARAGAFPRRRSRSTDPAAPTRVR